GLYGRQPIAAVGSWMKLLALGYIAVSCWYFALPVQRRPSAMHAEACLLKRPCGIAELPIGVKMPVSQSYDVGWIGMSAHGRALEKRSSWREEPTVKSTPPFEEAIPVVALMS